MSTPMSTCGSLRPTGSSGRTQRQPDIGRSTSIETHADNETHTARSLYGSRAIDGGFAHHRAGATDADLWRQSPLDHGAAVDPGGLFPDLSGPASAPSELQRRAGDF